MFKRSIVEVPYTGKCAKEQEKRRRRLYADTPRRFVSGKKNLGAKGL